MGYASSLEGRCWCKPLCWSLLGEKFCRWRVRFVHLVCSGRWFPTFLLVYYTLPKTNSLPLKHGGWFRWLSFWDCLFSGFTLVSRSNRRFGVCVWLLVLFLELRKLQEFFVSSSIAMTGRGPYPGFLNRGPGLGSNGITLWWNPKTPRGRAWIHHCDSHARTWLSRLVPSRWGLDWTWWTSPGSKFWMFFWNHSGLGIPSWSKQLPRHEATVAGRSGRFHEPDMDNLQVRTYT